MPVEHVADQRADAAVADDDDAGLLAVRRDFGRSFLALSGLSRCALRAWRAPGITEHRYRHRADQRRRKRAIDEAARERNADHHKAELAARPEQERHFGSDARDGRRNPRPSAKSVRPFIAISAATRPMNEARPRDDEGRIDPGADRHEVEPEQEAAERLDRELDLAAIFGLREKQPGDKGAERHRQMARRGGQPVAQHHQQARRHEELGALRFGDKTEEGPQGEAAEDDQRGQAERRRRRACVRSSHASPRSPPRRERADHHQKGRDRQILKQQHRQARAAGAGMKPFALDQHRNDDRGRGHRQRRADRQRRGRAKAETPGGGGRE